MGERGGFPYERWPRTTRADARLASRLARALVALDSVSALADAGSLLGAPVRLRRVGVTHAAVREVAGELGGSAGLVLAHGADRAVIALAPAIGRVIADRTVGGTGSEVALGPTPLTRGEVGLLGYVVGRALARSGTPGSLLDAGLAREIVAGWGEARVVAVAFDLDVGDARGGGALVAPLESIAHWPLPSPRLDPSIRVSASVVIGDARLPRSELAGLASGDVIVPDTLSFDPRVADTGTARLVVGRSSRVLEIVLSAGAWRVLRQTSLAAPRAPRSWKHRKDRPMSEPDTDTLQSLADVEVELSIELARLEMPVTEVASLAPGVVVTTGRLVGERVAVRAGERVIAWGELIDVEGEVGVRLTEVAPSST